MLSFTSAAEREELVDRLTEAVSRHRYELLRTGVAQVREFPVPVPWQQLSARTKRVRANQLRSDVEFLVGYLERHQSGVGEMSHTEETNSEEAPNV